MSKEQFKTNVHGVAIVLACVAKYTNFLKSNYNIDKEFNNLIKSKKTYFIGNLLLRLINISCTHRHRVSK